MRKAAGLTGDRMAEDLCWPRSKISKIENGRQMPSAEDIREALLHVAVYAGVPAANTAFRIVKKTFADMASAEREEKR